MRVRGLLRHGDAVRDAHRWLDHEPVDRRALLLRLLDAVLVDRQRERYLAGGDEAREKRMAAAHRDAVRRDELSPEAHAFRLAHVGDHRREPLVVIALDRELAFPLRREQVLEAPRQLALSHLVGVVGVHEHVLQRRHPFAVRGDGEVGVLLLVRRAHFLQQPFAPQRLELRRDGGDDIRRSAARPALGKRAVEDDLRARAPIVHLDAVAPLVGLDELVRVFGREGGVEEERPFLLRALDEPLLAIWAGIERELRQRLRLRRLQREQGGKINRDGPYFSHWLLRLTITSSKDFCHLSCSSIARPGSMSL